nr:MAG TPA: hypothetical protein [Caudoviricetes sp.]
MTSLTFLSYTIFKDCKFLVSSDVFIILNFLKYFFLYFIKSFY